MNAEAQPGDKRTRPDEASLYQWLAHDLSSLTFQEREIVHEELHGVSKSEVPELEAKADFVDQKISALRSAMASLPYSRRMHADKARFLHPSLFDDRNFLMLFLRCEKYNAEAAATRLCNHFRHKLDLWGPEKLALRITLDDLTEADLDLLRSGGIQLLPTTDTAGRMLLLAQPRHWHTEDYKSLLRVVWYLYMTRFLDAPEEQTRGCVSVVSIRGLGAGDVARIVDFGARGFIAHTENLPRLQMGYQVICGEDSASILMSPLNNFARGFRKQNRVRMRFHFGSAMEIRYALMTFGIDLPSNCLSEDPIVLHQIMDEYIEKRRNRDRELRTAEEHLIAEEGKISVPSAIDVLIGKGNQYYGYSGNLRIRKKIESLLEAYASGGNDRLWKFALSTNVVDWAGESGTRFLERKGAYWQVVDRQRACNKISQLFRTTIRKKPSEP